MLEGMRHPGTGWSDPRGRRVRT